VVAKAKKKVVKKRSAKQARKSRRAPAKAALKKRAKKATRGAKKARKAAGKTSAAKKKNLAPKKAPKNASKKASKKPPKKSASKTKSKKPSPAPKKANVAVKKPAAGKGAKAGAASAALVAAPSAPPQRNSFYITTAIAYPNGVPHIGHAYEAIATDALARFQRLDGRDVFFLTGTDEHGLKMIQTAESEGMTPADLATRNAGRFKEMDQRLNVSFDRFIRTSEPAHHRSVQEVWNRMQQTGDIYIDAYSGWYSVRDEASYAEEDTTVGEDNVRDRTASFLPPARSESSSDHVRRSR
jgi:methionyl-tRNA synthetase